MLKFADLLEERAEQFVHLDPLCMGIDPVLVKHVLIPACVEAFRCKWDILLCEVGRGADEKYGRLCGMGG
jgi:hypothetical protein